MEKLQARQHACAIQLSVRVPLCAPEDSRPTLSWGGVDPYTNPCKMPIIYIRICPTALKPATGVISSLPLPLKHQ